MDSRSSLKNQPGLRIVWLALACLLAALLTGAVCSRSDQAVQWAYDGPGAPKHWASLSEEYATCADGQQQSPIDIAGYSKGDAAPISFSYSADATSVRNDGKHVYVDYAAGNTLKAGQWTYELKSAHFHSPSEHRIDGASFAAELHLVHADADGNLAVVGLLFMRTGRAQPRSAGDSRCCPGCRRYCGRRLYSQCQGAMRRASSAITGTTAQRRHPRAMNRLTGM